MKLWPAQQQMQDEIDKLKRQVALLRSPVNTFCMKAHGTDRLVSISTWNAVNMFVNGHEVYLK